MADLGELLPAAGWPRFACDVIWQSTVIGICAWIALRWLVRHPSMRAATALLAVALMLLVPALSWMARSTGFVLIAETPQERLAERGETDFDLHELASRTEVDTAGVPSSETPAAAESAEVAAAPGASTTVSNARSLNAEIAAGVRPWDVRSRSWTWLAILWGISSLVLGSRLLRSVYQLYRICRNARRCEHPLIVGACQRAASRIRLRCHAELLLSQQVSTPAVVAFRRPQLLIPDRADETTESEWFSIFCHELAHVRRNDGWWLLFMELARVILPWQPFVWWLAREHGRASEDACDDWVVSTGTDPLDFATVLTNWIPRQSPGLLIGFGGRSLQATRRIARLLRMDAPPKPELSTSRIACAVALSGLLSVAIAVTQSDRADVAAGEPATTESGDSANSPALPGLVPEPAELPGVRRWQMATRDAQGHTTSIAWSPDSQLIAFSESGNVRIHEAKTMRLVRILVGHTAMIRTVAWSPDGKWLATCSDDKSVRLWSAEGRPGSIIRHHTAPVMCVAWSPNSQFVVSASADNTVRVWDLIGSSVRVFNGHKATVRAVAWSSSDEWIASAGDDKTVRLWNWRNDSRQVRAGHEYPITCLAWHPDGSRVVSGDANPGNRYESGTLRVWNVDGTPGIAVEKSRGGCTGLAWSTDGQRIVAVGALPFLEQWESDGSHAGEFGGTRGELECVAWSPDGKSIAVGGLGDPVSLWNADGSAGLVLDKRMGQTIWTLAWSPTGDWIAAGERRGDVQLWKSDGMPGRRLRMDDNAPEREHWALQALDWSPDGTQLVAGAADTAVWLWNADGMKGTQLSEQGEHVVSAAWSPDGTQIALAGMKPAGLGVKSPAWVQLWQSDGTRGRQFDPLPHSVESIAWSPDSQQVVAGCFDGTVRIWNSDGNAGPIMEGHNSWVISVDWSRDGEWIASGGVDKKVRLWKPDGTPGPVLTGHTGDIRSVAWSPDSQWLASGSWDNSVRLWKADGTVGPVFNGYSWIYSVKWSPDSERIVFGSLDGTIRVWNISTQQIEWIGFALPDGELTALSESGEFLYGDTATIDREFVYLVESPSGALDVMSPSAFREAQSQAR